MNVVNVVQGTSEWHKLRARRYTASEAAAMLGLSKYMTRAELLRQKATGETEEVSRSKQAIYDRGHAAEAAARQAAEEIVGEELYPVTATLDIDSLPLLASFDGATVTGEIIWEHKLRNKSLVQQIKDEELSDQYWPQLEQQLLISGATRCLFMVSDGGEGALHLWYTSVPERRDQLLAGWRQFAVDLTNYQPQAAEPEAVGRAPEALPALHIEVRGDVTASNLDQYRDRALAVLSGINTDLATDNDFADAERAVKWCKDIEGRLEAAKDHALSQTASIDDLFRALDMIKDEARAKRLELDRLVKARKQAIRGEIVSAAKEALAKHITEIDKTLDGLHLPPIDGGFAEAMKGKRTITSMRDAVDGALANAMIAANQAADHIRGNLAILAEQAKDYGFLFRDLQQLIAKPPEDFDRLVKSRVSDYLAEQQAAEEARARREQEAAEDARAHKEQEPPIAPPQKGRLPDAPTYNGDTIGDCREVIGEYKARGSSDTIQFVGELMGNKIVIIRQTRAEQ